MGVAAAAGVAGLTYASWPKKKIPASAIVDPFDKDRYLGKWNEVARLPNVIEKKLRDKGIKRHVIVDKNGFLVAVMATVANVHDSKAVTLLMRVLKEMLCSIKVIIADGGYRGEIIEKIKKSFGYIIQVVMRSDDKRTGFKPVHKRWVVENELLNNAFKLKVLIVLIRFCITRTPCKCGSLSRPAATSSSTVPVQF